MRGVGSAGAAYEPPSLRASESERFRPKDDEPMTIAGGWRLNG